MKMSIRAKLMLFISFLFLTVIGNSVFTFQLESYEEEKLKWVEHTHDVLITTEKFLSGLKDTETGQRGFLLTHDTSYLEPYYAGMLEAKKRFKILRKLTSDNPKQQQRLDSIQTLMDLKLEELANTISLTETETETETDENKALEIIKLNKVKQYMDDIRSLLSDFNNTEAILLEQRKGDFRAHRSQITTLITAEIVFFITLALMAIPFLNRNFFHPLKLLISNIHKMEAGEKIDITDVVAKDEMGYLLSRFFQMNEKIHSRTQMLNYKVHHDELTGLKNRTNLYEDIQNAIEQLTKANAKCAVFFLDLNKFKQLNDTFGHDAGDAVLISTATRIKNTIRSNDTVFRIGGDEFVVLITDVTSVSEIEKIARKILDAFETPMIIQGQLIEMSPSIGISVSPDDSKNSEEVVNFSDIAMYAAKNDDSTHLKFFNRDMLQRAADL
jgi:diguanylate cyclase (GGDEF)-like protein